MVPTSVLSRMGENTVEIDGVQLRVRVHTDPKLIEEHVQEMINFLRVKDSSVVGFDCRGSSTFLSKIGVVVLCLPVVNYCLVAQLKKWSTSRQLNQLFDYAAHRNSSLVGVDVTRIHYFGAKRAAGINAGELVARVRNKPGLFKSTNLGEIAPEAGIDYDTIIGPGDRPAFDRKKESYSYWKNMVFSDDQLKALVYDAYMCCKIGQKLLGKERQTG